MLALPCWARLTIDEQGVRVVDYWLIIPWSRHVLESPVDVGRDEGVDYETDGIILQSRDDYDEAHLWGRSLFQLLPRIRELVAQRRSPESST